MESRIAVADIGKRLHANASIAVVGVPNSGKSTLFNRLTGLRQKTGNYPGVTVERHVGTANLGRRLVELIDLPGLFSLGSDSIEERLAIDVVLGRHAEGQSPSGILAVVSAANLYQGLFLIHQLQEVGLPIVVALTMTDAASANGIEHDIQALQQALGGTTICPVIAPTGAGIDDLKNALAELPERSPPVVESYWPELHSAVSEMVGRASDLTTTEAVRSLVDADSARAESVAQRLGGDGARYLMRTRDALFGEEPPLAEEARRRYAWVRDTLKRVETRAPALTSWASRFAAWSNRPVPGTIGLFLVMALVFQAVFAWATPLMDAIDGVAASLGSAIYAAMPEGALASLLADGVVAGVGSVVIFLPQILILFLFIIVLEDSGYLARAAYLMDRAMRSVGLSGQSVIPMISSFACAVPGIMATRVIPNRRDRIATILAAPFMTCSARLPVYALLIAAFVPERSVGILNLQGLVLFGLYMLGIVAGLVTALILRQTALKGPKPAFALMLPEFRRPNPRTVLMQLWARAKVFLYRAGTIIFAVAVLVWALAYFPQSSEVDASFAAERAAIEQASDAEVRETLLVELENRAAAAQLEQSWLGRIGKVVEPVFQPLGWDWKVSAAVIAGFPAREVVVAVLGTIYAVGGDADETTLTDRLRGATWPDGAPVFTVPMVIGLLIFYACCLQCAATLAVIRRETNSWRWPIFAWCYMTSIGYLGALVAFQLGS